MASSNARHVRNRVRGADRLFEWLVTRRPIERKPMDSCKVVEGFAMGNGVCDMKTGLRGL